VRTALTAAPLTPKAAAFDAPRNPHAPSPQKIALLVSKPKDQEWEKVAAIW
jgi:hypothetical protein